MNEQPTTNTSLDKQNELPEKENGESDGIGQKGGIGAEKLTETDDIDKKEQERTTINKKLVVENWFTCKGVVELVCDKVGISRETFYQYRRNDAVFRNKLIEIDNDAGDIGEDILRGLAFVKKDPGSLRFWLRANNKKYKLKIEQQIIGGSSKSPKQIIEEYNEARRIQLEKNGKPNDTTKSNGGDTTRINEGGLDKDIISDKEQEGGISTVRVEQSTEILLEKENEKKPDSESKTKGNLEDHRRRPAPRLYAERN